MLSRPSLFALAALLTASFAAHATPTTYELSATTDYGFPITGTVTIDPSDGAISGANLVENGNVFYTILDASGSNPFESYAVFGSSNVPAFSILLAIDSSDYATPTLCITGVDNCDFSAFSNVAVYGVTADPFASGSLAPTPEPSSLVLLGTGLIGAAGAARRRLMKA